MSLKAYAKFEPVRLSVALLAFGVAVAGLIALLSTAAIGGAVGGVWAAGVGIFQALFVRDSVTPNVSVNEKVHDTIVALAPLAPSADQPTNARP